MSTSRLNFQTGKLSDAPTTTIEESLFGKTFSHHKTFAFDDDFHPTSSSNPNNLETSFGFDQRQEEMQKANAEHQKAMREAQTADERKEASQKHQDKIKALQDKFQNKQKKLMDKMK